MTCKTWWPVLLAAIVLGMLGGRVVVASEAPTDARGDASQPPEFGPEGAAPEVREAIALAERGDLAGGIARLEKHLSAEPDALYGRVALGAMLDWDGRSDEAVAVWMKGLTGTPVDIHVWMAVGRLRLRQGKDGPTVSHRRGSVTYHPRKQDESEERFERMRLCEAAEAFANAVAIAPDAVEPATGLAQARELLGEHKEAARVWRDLHARQPGEAWILVSLARSLLAAGETREAMTSVSRALDLDPRSADAHRLKAEELRAQGEGAQADENDAMADFYTWLPPFATTTYTAEDQRISALFTDASKADSEAIAAVLARLEAEDSPRSRDLLAAVIWGHRMHGPIEDELFATLEDWRAADTLLGLAEYGQTTCTIGGAFRALARLKDPRVLDLLLEALPGDTRFFLPVDVAGALALLGDARAVPHLVRVLDPTLEQSRVEGGQDDEAMTEHGRLYARGRAALALGAFATPDSRSALEKCTGNAEVAPFCHAALYRLDSDKRHLTTLGAAAPGQLDPTSRFMVAEYLTAIGDPEAAALAQTIDPPSEE
jgi:tetratricopeptide (TPR) repeat protein